MHRVPTAAAFIKANMPLGQGGTLTDQQAWDVAAFMNSHPRPVVRPRRPDGLEASDPYAGSPRDPGGSDPLLRFGSEGQTLTPKADATREG